MTNQPQSQAQNNLNATVTTTNANPPSILLTLTQDEVAFLLRMLQADSMPSFQIPDSFNEALAAAASRSLRARGVAHVTSDGKFAISEGILAIIQSCLVFAQQLTVLHRSSDGITHSSWIYIAQGITVQHRIIEPGVHTFQTIPDGQALLLALAMGMALRPDDATIAPMQFTLPFDLWESARNYLNVNDLQGAGATLANEGVPEAFAQAVVEAQRRSVVTVIGALPDKSLSMTGLYVLDVEEGYWLVQPTTDGTELMIATTNGRKILDVISDLMLGLSSAQHS